MRRRRQLPVEQAVSPGLAWPVAVKQEPGSPRSPLARSVVLRPVSHLSRFDERRDLVAATICGPREGRGLFASPGRGLAHLNWSCNRYIAELLLPKRYIDSKESSR